MKLKLLLALLLLFGIVSCSQSVDPKIKKALIRGHSGTCLPTIQAQVAKAGKDSQSQEVVAIIKKYCSCLGHKYFDDFTIEDHEWLKNNGSLPPRVAAKRSQYQIQCSE